MLSQQQSLRPLVDASLIGRVYFFKETHVSQVQLAWRNVYAVGLDDSEIGSP